MPDAVLRSDRTALAVVPDVDEEVQGVAGPADLRGAPLTSSRDTAVVRAGAAGGTLPDPAEVKGGTGVLTRSRRTVDNWGGRGLGDRGRGNERHGQGFGPGPRRRAVGRRDRDRDVLRCGQG